MKRICRKVTSLLAVVALLCTQLAVSAYACPMLTQTDGEQSMATSVSVPSAVEADVDQPGLCQKHCENGQQNVNDSGTGLASVTPAPAFVIALPTLQPSPVLGTAVFSSLLHAASPPIHIRNCCFRI